jgi:hypothetical protein
MARARLCRRPCGKPLAFRSASNQGDGKAVGAGWSNHFLSGLSTVNMKFFAKPNRGEVLREFLLVAGLVILQFAGPSFSHNSPRSFARAPSESESQAKPPVSPYGAPTIVARLKDSPVRESSGLVASRANAGAYWTHNDSGDGPFIYSFDGKGESLGVWRVRDATADDWEDIAIGPGPIAHKPYIYIGDIGDNDESRAQVVVYRFTEPTFTPEDRNSTKANPLVTEAAVAFRFRYPDGKHDAETLLVHPTTGDLYIITKVALAKPVVYKASPPFDPDQVTTLKRLGEVKVPSIFGGVLTGGDISPDGKRVALCDYFQGYELLLPATASSFDDIWKQQMVGFDLGKRKQGESIAYRLDGKAVLATSEGKRTELIQVVLR